MASKRHVHLAAQEVQRLEVLVARRQGRAEQARSAEGPFAERDRLRRIDAVENARRKLAAARERLGDLHEP